VGNRGSLFLLSFSLKRTLAEGGGVVFKLKKSWAQREEKMLLHVVTSERKICRRKSVRSPAARVCFYFLQVIKVEIIST
jgi:hypothetical protein